MPWHPDAARIVSHADVVRLLRAETVELLTSVTLLIAGINYFFSDILNYYMDYLSLPLAVVAHLGTTLIGALLVFGINNASVSFVRVRMVRDLPKAPGNFTADALRRWAKGQRVWILSILGADRAAGLNKFAVLLYILMFLCSGPLLAIVLILLATSGRARTLDGTVSTVMAFYIVISLWALIESTLVLRQRMLAGRERRAAKDTAAQSS